MKTRVVSFFLMSVFALLIGCQDKNKGMRWITTQNEQDIFTVTVEAAVAKSDDFSLYYTTNGSTDFSKIKPIWVAVKGSSDLQQIVFRLPEKVHPTQLRLDFGKNPDQKEIFLSKVYMSCKGKMLEIPSTLIFSYFQPDITKTEFDAAKGIIRGKIVSGKRQSPSLYPKERPLGKKIKELLAPIDPK